MTDNEKLIKILRVPIFSHELADPTEAVADYLLDNDVVPVVRCKDCKCWNAYGINGKVRFGRCKRMVSITKVDDFCSYGERKDNGK